MVPLWFTLSALCFVGAAVLLYVDIDRRRGLGRRRKSWAKSHGFDYEHESHEILKRWKRGVMSTVGDVTAKNVVLGQIRGEAVFIFDIEEVATVIALHRKVGTNVVVDLRLKGIKEPRESDIWLLGAIGPRMVYSTNLDAARRACDRRMVDVRPHRPRLRRDHVERAELDARQHAGHEYPRPMGRGTAHCASVQRPAAGTTAGSAERCGTPVGSGQPSCAGASRRIAQPPVGADARRAPGAASGPGRRGTRAWRRQSLHPAAPGARPSRCGPSDPAAGTQRPSRTALPALACASEQFSNLLACLAPSR